MKSYQTIKVTLDGPLATITVDRPASLNAMSSQVISELRAATAELEHEAGVRVVAITGSGEKAFIAGADISEMQDLNAMQAAEFAAHGHGLGVLIETSKKPYIAQVNGFALGGGCELALACDFIYAADTAKFGQPEVKLGVIPGFGGTQRLARRVGVAKCKELCMTGDTIDAAEALRIGLVDLVVPGAELAGKVKAVAAKIAQNGPLAVAEVKRLVHEGQSMTLDHARALETAAFGLLFATADQREGMSAFLAKPRRAAQFKGQ